MIRAVLFDMDGVLLDTEPLYTDVYQMICQEHGKDFTSELKAKIMGSKEQVSAQIVIDELGLPLDPVELIDKKHQLIESLFANCSALPGAREIVQEFKDQGLPIAVATSSSRAMFELKTQKHSWFEQFDAIITGDMVERAKPEPDIFLLAAKTLNVNPTECLVFEDSLNGVAAARAAKMEVIAVPAVEFAQKFKQPGLVVLPSLNAFSPTCWEIAP